MREPPPHPYRRLHTYYTPAGLHGRYLDGFAAFCAAGLTPAYAAQVLVPRFAQALARVSAAVTSRGKVYAAAAEPLREAGVAVLQDEALPFPLGNWRAKFVTGFRRALLAAMPELPERLARVIREDEIARWAATPNKALDGRTVLAAILSGDEHAVLELVAHLEYARVS